MERISGKICRSYSDLNFGVTFFGTQCILSETATDQRLVAASFLVNLETLHFGHVFRHDLRCYLLVRPSLITTNATKEHQLRSIHHIY